MGSELEIKGLDELIGDFEKLAQAAPDYAIEGMDNVGKRFKKEIKDYVHGHTKSDEKLTKGNYVSKTNGIRFDVYKLFSGETHNINPHWHLVENGHRKVRPNTEFGHPSKNGGEVLGWTEGIHSVDAVTATFNEAVADELEKVLDKAVKAGGF